MRARPEIKWLLVAGVAAVALPALAQEAAPAPTPPAQPAAPSATPAAPASSPPVVQPAESEAQVSPNSGSGRVVESDTLSPEELAEVPKPPPPVEMPSSARRDPRTVGVISPQDWGFGASPWGQANGRFLSGLMRRLDTPLPSRWLHITLRNALLARSEAPPAVHPVDWVAERAWLLLRMGEADGAAMLVAGVDVDDFTPKMSQVAVQSALASADPAGLCPLRERVRRLESRIHPLVEAMCAALEGQAAVAASGIEQARRRGRISGIDHVLADKVVGAGADTGRAVTVEWEGVEGLTAWRFGLATATGIAPPDWLMARAPHRVRAWQARAPLLSAEQRLASARIATGLGVFSASALGDLYATIYDQTDPGELDGTDALSLREAFIAPSVEERVERMRRLWQRNERRPLERLANLTLTSLAASRIQPSAALGNDVPDLLASMLAGGYSTAAARWAAVADDLDEEAADRSWALLALGTTAPVDLSIGRIERFLDADDSIGKARSRLLVAGLAGTGRIDGATASSLNDDYGLGLGRTNGWTRLIDRAGSANQGGSAVLLAAIGLQAADPASLPASSIFRGLTAMRLAGLDYQARMIAAELLART